MPPKRSIAIAVKDALADAEELRRMLEADDSRSIERGVREYVHEIEIMYSRIIILSNYLVEEIQKLEKEIESSTAPEKLAERVQDLRQYLDLLNVEFDWLDRQTEIAIQQSAPTPGLLSKAKGWIKSMMNWILKISKTLWNILVGLMTPKEWSLSGKVGTGLLGLVDVELEIKFGP